MRTARPQSVEIYMLRLYVYNGTYKFHFDATYKYLLNSDNRRGHEIERFGSFQNSWHAARISTKFYIASEVITTYSSLHCI